jgi:acyl carrier protein
MHSETIREIVAAHARLRVDVSTLHDDADLYEAGLTSLSTVNLMLALEERFDVEFTDKMLKRRTFQSIASLSAAISELTGTPSPLGEGRGEGQMPVQQLRGVA